MLFNFRAVWLFISTFLISVTPSQFICPVHIYTICFLVTRISVDSYLISVQHFRILPLYTVTTFSLIDTPTTLVVNITSFNSMGDLTGNDAMVDEDHVLNDLVCRRLDWDSFIDGVDQTAHSGTTVDDSFVSRVTDSNFIPLRGGAKMRAKVTSKRMTTKNTTPRKKYKMIKKKTPTKKKGETNQESSSDEQSGSEGSPKDKTPRSKCIIIRRKTPIKEIEKNQESSSDRESGSDNSTMSADITGGYENPPGNPPKKKAGKGKKKAANEESSDGESEDEIKGKQDNSDSSQGSDDDSEDEGKGRPEESDNSQGSDDENGSEGSGNGTDGSGTESGASSSSEGSDISYVSGYSIPDVLPPSVTHKQVKGKNPTWDAFKPSSWKQFYLWNSPFIKLLDAIAYDRTSLSDYLNKIIPSRDVKPKIDALSRTNKYWAVEHALGRTLEHLGEHLGLPSYGVTINVTGKKGKDRVLYKQAKQELAEKHENALGDMVFLRERFWSEPSIFWNLPPIYIFGLLAHIGHDRRSKKFCCLYKLCS